MGLVLILLFLAFAAPVALLLASGSEQLAALGLIYLRITVFASQLVFVLSVNSDALRNEGRVPFMAAMSLLVSLSNMGFNYVLIWLPEMGVARSAKGTALAQALGIILAFRNLGTTDLRPSVLVLHSLVALWWRILALGAPQSLNFIGLALGSTAILVALQWVEVAQFDATVSAYGIITRLITFAFLPLLELAHAMQTITGHSFGVDVRQRTGKKFRKVIPQMNNSGAMEVRKSKSQKDLKLVKPSFFAATGLAEYYRNFRRISD